MEVCPPARELHFLDRLILQLLRLPESSPGYAQGFFYLLGVCQESEHIFFGNIVSVPEAIINKYLILFMFALSPTENIVVVHFSNFSGIKVQFRVRVFFRTDWE